MKTNRLFVDDDIKAYVALLRYLYRLREDQKRFKGVDLMPGVIGCSLVDICETSDCTLASIEKAFKMANDRGVITTRTKDHINFWVTFNRG